MVVYRCAYPRDRVVIKAFADQKDAIVERL